jgi:hypothetical protein
LTSEEHILSVLKNLTIRVNGYYIEFINSDKKVLFYYERKYNRIIMLDAFNWCFFIKDDYIDYGIACDEIKEILNKHLKIKLYIVINSSTFSQGYVLKLCGPKKILGAHK